MHWYKKRKSLDISKDDEELLWLKGCMVGEVKNMDYLNEINFILKGGGFHQCLAKYIGGRKVVLEWSSDVCMKKAMDEGKSALLEWFNWVEPWSRSVESRRESRLV